MKTEVECPECNGRFKVDEELIGRKGRCPSCQSAFVITAALPDRSRPKKRKNAGSQDAVPTEATPPKQRRSATSGPAILPIIGTVALVGGIAVGSILYFAMNKAKPKADDAAVASTAPQPLISEQLSKSETAATPDETDTSQSGKMTEKPESPQGTLSAASPPREAQPEKLPATNPNPLEITFPAKRKFEHRWPILEAKQPADKLLIYTLILKKAAEDQEDTVVCVDLVAHDPMQNPNGRSLWEAVQLRIGPKGSSWHKLSDQNLLITLDGDLQNITTYARKKDRDDFAVMIPLPDFQKMLSAQQIQIQAGQNVVVLNESHVEGMRDLASRSAEGTTKEGNFVVSLKPDPAAATVAAQPTSDSDDLPPALAQANAQRKQDAVKQIERIDALKRELKQAKIADDAKAAAKAVKQISDEQNKLRDLTENLLDLPTLLPSRFTVGAVGRLLPDPLEVIQVIDRKKGEVLVDMGRGRSSKEFIISGINADNLVDRDRTRIGHNLCFHVAKIEDYKTVDGGTNSVYRLEVYPASFQISDADRKLYDDALNTEYKIELTAEEEVQAQKSREASAQQNMDKEKLARSRRSKSNLESAKLLLRKEEKAAAKKYLEKAVADDPDSEAGKEAAKLLENLP